MQLASVATSMTKPFSAIDLQPTAAAAALAPLAVAVQGTSHAAATNSSERMVHAAHLLPILGAAQAAAVGLSQLGGSRGCAV